MKVYFLEGRNVSYLGVNRDLDSHDYRYNRFRSESPVVISIAHYGHTGHNAESEVTWRHGGRYKKQDGVANYPHSQVAKILKAVRVAVVHHVKKMRPKRIVYSSNDARKIKIYHKGLNRVLTKHGYSMTAEPISGIENAVKHTWSRP